MMDMQALLADFVVHVNAMTSVEIEASIQRAHQLTSGCSQEVGDIDEYVQLDRTATESQSFTCNVSACDEYMFSSAIKTKLFTTDESWNGKEAAA